MALKSTAIPRTIPCTPAGQYHQVMPERVLYNLSDMSKHEQCCGRRHLLYQKNTMEPATCIWASTVLWAPTKYLVPDSVGNNTRKHTHTLPLSRTCKVVPFIYKRGWTLSQHKTNHLDSLSASFRYSEHSNSFTALEF